MLKEKEKGATPRVSVQDLQPTAWGVKIILSRANLSHPQLQQENTAALKKLCCDNLTHHPDDALWVWGLRSIHAQSERGRQGFQLYSSSADGFVFKFNFRAVKLIFNILFECNLMGEAVSCSLAFDERCGVFFDTELINLLNRNTGMWEYRNIASYKLLWGKGCLLHLNLLTSFNMPSDNLLEFIGWFVIVLTLTAWRKYLQDIYFYSVTQKPIHIYICKWKIRTTNNTEKKKRRAKD